MAILKCKMCGGDLSVEENGSVVECEYCGTKQTVPQANDEKKVNLFNRANRLRMSSEFDKAVAIYEQIIAEYPEEAEAYWCLCLCNYGIEYVDDPATAQKIPTVHRAAFEKLRKDENYALACEYADMSARLLYQEQAKEIDRIMGEILSVSQKEEPYDLFICYKETDPNGGRTPDSVLAQEIYDTLTNKGYKAFFSRITLEDKLGQQYEPYIFAALNSAKVMLAVGTDFEYYNAVWVKNEWSRYLKLAAKDKTKTLIPCYKDMDAYDMPDEFKGLQAQDMGKLGWMQDLTRGIDKLFGRESQPKVVTEKVIVQQTPGTDVGNLLRRMYMFLEDENWASAAEYSDKVLDIDAENAEAYLGAMMAEKHFTVLESVVQSDEDFTADKNWQKAAKFADETLSAKMADVNVRRQKRYQEKEQKASIIRKQLQGEYLSAGGRHTVGLKSDGTVVATKFTGDMELNHDQCEVSYWRDIVAISAGHGHTVGLKSDGTVVATKYLGDMELYVGQCEVSGWRDIVAISAGDDHTVGLKSDGTVVATKFTGKYTVSMLFYCGKCEVSGWRDIVAISAGGRHTVGLKSDGTVVATKFTGDMELNHGQCEVSDWRDIVAISAGKHHTVGLKSDGTVVATKYTGKPEYYSGECEVSGWRDIVAISAGSSHTVGLKSDGTVVATKFPGYTSDNRGQCEVSGWRGIVAISAGSTHTVGLKSDGTVVATKYTGELKWDVGQCEVSDMKLFADADDLLTILEKNRETTENIRAEAEKRRAEEKRRTEAEQERRAAEKKRRAEAEQERRAAEEKRRAEAEQERRAAEEKLLAEAEQARLAKIKQLEEERARITAELPTIKGLFSGGKKRDLENRLAAINSELAKLRK